MISTITFREDQWAKIVSFLRTCPGVYVRRETALRRFLEGVLWIFADDFRQVLADKPAEAVIPSRKNRKAPRDYDQNMYKERHLVECLIKKLKQYRRIFARFDKLDQRYLGFLSLAGALIWLH